MVAQSSLATSSRGSHLPQPRGSLTKSSGRAPHSWQAQALRVV